MIVEKGNNKIVVVVVEENNPIVPDCALIKPSLGFLSGFLWLNAWGDWVEGAMQPALQGWTGTNQNKHGGSEHGNTPNTGTHSIQKEALFRRRRSY